jgi:hypothetical protein
MKVSPKELDKILKLLFEHTTLSTEVIEFKLRWPVDKSITAYMILRHDDLIDDFGIEEEPRPYVLKIKGKGVKFYNDGGYTTLYRKQWAEINPVKDRLRTASIGAGFSLLVGIILWLLANQKQHQVDQQQNRLIDSLTNSIANFEKNRRD